MNPNSSVSVKALIHPTNSEALALKLFGPKHDGSYVLASSLLANTHAAYSYGIGANVGFDLDLANNYDFPIFQYDHTIADTPVKNNKFIFKKEALSSANIIKHLTENGHLDRDDLLLKIDTEGAEYELFANTDINIFNSFNQIAIEIHNVKDLDPKCITLLTSLFTLHKLVHVHGNNYGPMIDGLPVTLELTLVRNNLIPPGARLSNNSIPIKDLDTPNNPRKEDYVLSWWVKQD
jgi:hypothetical protein